MGQLGKSTRPLSRQASPAKGPTVIFHANSQVGLFVVVSGLPASGKSTVGRIVAARLGLSFLDKDEFLEALFESLGTGDQVWRKRLSRAADGALRAAAERSPGAVVVSWWRHPNAISDSGTDVEWLRGLHGPMVELHCACTPPTACTRMFERQRHKGHLDHLKTMEIELASFEEAAALGPLGIGPVIVCDTESGQNFDNAITALRAHGS